MNTNGHQDIDDLVEIVNNFQKACLKDFAKIIRRWSQGAKIQIKISKIKLFEDQNSPQKGIKKSETPVNFKQDIGR
jgi:acylphosphatase